MLIKLICSGRDARSQNPEKPKNKMNFEASKLLNFCLRVERFHACAHRDDVNEVIFPQCVQDCVDGVFGDGQSEPLHAATHVHHDDHVFGRSGGLDVPRKRQTYLTLM